MNAAQRQAVADAQAAYFAADDLFEQTQAASVEAAGIERQKHANLLIVHNQGLANDQAAINDWLSYQDTQRGIIAKAQAATDDRAQKHAAYDAAVAASMVNAGAVELINPNFIPARTV